MNEQNRVGVVALLLVLVSTIAPSPALAQGPSTASEPWILAPPPLQREVLVEAAKGGSLAAARRMVELGMYDEMAQIDVSSSSVRAWTWSEERVHGMTGRQVFGIVLANRAARLGSREEAAIDLELARVHLRSAEVESPCVALTLAWLLESFAPAGLEEARGLREGLESRFLTAAQGRDDLVAASFHVQSGEAARALPARAWDRAALHYAEAARLSARVEDLAGLARVRMAEGFCLRPGNHPAGSWSLAAARYEEAAELKGRAGLLGPQAAALHAQSWCLQRIEGTWPRVAALLEASAELYGRAGLVGNQAGALETAGLVLGHPERDPARAAAAHARSAALYELQGDAGGQFGALANLGNCLRPSMNPQGSWAEAAEAYRRAVALFDRLKEGSEGAKALVLLQLAECVRANIDSAGSWAEAARLYAESAEFARIAGDTSGQAEALRRQGECLRPVDPEAPGPGRPGVLRKPPKPEPWRP